MISFKIAFAILCGVIDKVTIDGVGEVDGWEIWKAMQETYHSDDNNHYGESIWEHSERVYDRLGLSVDDPASLINRTAAWAAVMHDIGKIWVAEYNEEKGKTTFYKHAIFSERVAEVFMERIRLVPPSMAIIPDYPLAEMVRWHDAVIQLQQNRKPDFSHMKKVEKPFKNLAIRNAFIDLIQADCCDKNREKKQKWAKDFETDFEGWQRKLFGREQLEAKRAEEGQRRFEASRHAIEVIVRESLGEDAVRVVTEAETPKDLGRLFGELSKAGKGEVIKRVKNFYEVK